MGETQSQKKINKDTQMKEVRNIEKHTQKEVKKFTEREEGGKIYT